MKMDLVFKLANPDNFENSSRIRILKIKRSYYLALIVQVDK